jgi:nucleoside-diphosphate-sugar epimerase
MTAEEHRRSIALLADVAARHHIRRLVHCSTAVVVGRTRAPIVSEDTPCQPTTDYERAKYGIEMALGAAAVGRFPLAVLRPTAVFGPGLHNLVALIDALRDGHGVVNYARASLFGRRHLHLLPVETVIAALLFATLGLDGYDGVDQPARYIVSADDEPGGDFCTIEARIRRSLGLPAAPPPVKIPSVGLRLMLRAAGRSDTNPQRVYDGSRLRKRGFLAPVALGEAIDRYLVWYRSMPKRSGGA